MSAFKLMYTRGGQPPPYSDVVILTGGEKVHAHKLVPATIPWFENCMRFNAQAKVMEGSPCTEIDLTEDDPVAVYDMIDSIYLGFSFDPEMPPLTRLPQTDLHGKHYDLLSLLNLYRLADQYQFDDLRTACKFAFNLQFGVALHVAKHTLVTNQRANDIWMPILVNFLEQIYAANAGVLELHLHKVIASVMYDERYWMRRIPELQELLTRQNCELAMEIERLEAEQEARKLAEEVE